MPISRRNIPNNTKAKNLKSTQKNRNAKKKQVEEGEGEEEKGFERSYR
jgi:hypothetical protein